MRLLFAHGRGFDRALRAPLRALLAERPQAIDDYRCVARPSPFPDTAEPCLAVTRGFGTLRMPADPPPGLA